jgi:hypothetical protein
LITALQIRRNGDLGFGHLSLGLREGGGGSMIIRGLQADGILDALSIQPDQFVACLHFRTALDHPDDGAVTPDFAFDFRIVGTFQGPLLGYCDDQVAACDRVRQPGSGFPVGHGAGNESGRNRNHSDRANYQKTAFAPSGASRILRVFVDL